MSAELGRAIDALGDPGRRELLEQLARGPRTAAQLATELTAPAPVLTEWLAALLGAGLVAQDGEAQAPVYQVNSRALVELRDYLERILGMPKAELSGVPVARAPEPVTFQLPVPQPVPVQPATLRLRREVVVELSRADAFRRFTKEMEDWWPLGRHHFGTAQPVTVVMEPKAGGRWYEKGDDGSETAWGEVLAFQPDRRVMLSWRVDADWRPAPSAYTEVEAVFAALSPAVCRLRLEHRFLEPEGGPARRARDAFDREDGWTSLLERFADLD